MKKISILIFIMLSMFINISVYANGITVDGVYFPNVVKNMKTGKTFNSFLLQNKYTVKDDKKTINLFLPFLNNKIELLTIKNQYAYVPVISNNNDPYNLSPLKDTSKTLLLEKDGYVGDFKSMTYDTRLPYPFISYDNRHFRNSQGILGLYRKVADKEGNQVGTSGFYVDVVNKNIDFLRRKVYNKPITLHGNNYIIQNTEVNKRFDDIMAKYNKEGLTENVKYQLIPFARNYLISYAVSTQQYSSTIYFEMFDNGAITKTDSYGYTIPGYPRLENVYRVNPFSDTKALIEQMKRFYSIQVHSELVSYGVGSKAMMAHQNKGDFYIQMSVGALDGQRDLLIHNYDIFKNQVIEDYVRLIDKATNQELPYKWITKKLNGTFDYKFKEYIISDKTKPLKLEYDLRFLYAQGYSTNQDGDAITNTLNTMIFTDAFIKSGTTTLKEYKYNVPISEKGRTTKLKSYVSNPLDEFVYEILSGNYDGTKIMDEVRTYYPDEKATYSIDIDPSTLTDTSYAEIGLSEAFNSYNMLAKANDLGTPYSSVPVSLNAFSEQNKVKITSSLGAFGTKYLNGTNALIFNDNEHQVYSNDKTFIYFKFEDTIAQDLKISVDSIDGKVEPGAELTVKGKVFNKSEDKTKVDKIKVNFRLNTDGNGNDVDMVRNSPTTASVLIKTPKFLNGYNAETKTYDFWTYEYKIKIPTTVKANDILYLATSIPSEYDGNANIYLRDDDFIQKELAVNQTYAVSKLNDMSIDVWLVDSSGKIYNTKNQQGTYTIEPEKAYSVIVEIKKVKGTEIVSNPSFLLSYKTSSNSPYSSYTLNATGSIRSVGDKVQYKLPVMIPSQFFDVRAEINPVYTIARMDGVILDDNKDNNIASKLYANLFDLELSKINLSQNKHNITNNNNTPIPLTVSGMVTLSSTSVNQVNNVRVDLYKNDVFLATRTQTFYKGVDNVVSFNLPSQIYTVGNTGFEIRVNPDRAYKEFNGSTDPYLNNNKKTALSVYNTDTIPDACVFCNGMSAVLSNQWSVKYHLFDGGCYSEYTYPILDKDGNVIDYKTVKYCDNPSPKFKGIEERQHSESISLIAEIATEKTNWQWQTLSSSNNTINAGKGFKIRFKANYKTDRINYPSVDVNECGSSITPTANMISSITNLQISTNYNFATLPTNKFFNSNAGVYTANSTTPTWYNYTYTAELKQSVDKTGNKTNILYTEPTDRNQSITFQVFTNSFQGHGKRWDGQSTHKDLIECKTFTVYIKDPLSIIDQEIKK